MHYLYATTESYKIKLDCSLSIRRTFQYLVVKTLPVLAVSQLAWVRTSLQWNWDTQIGWLPVAWYQMGLPIRSNSSSCHYAGLKCYLVLLIPTSSMAYFDNNLFNKRDEKYNDPSICWDFTVFKGLISLGWTQFKPI